MIRRGDTIHHQFRERVLSYAWANRDRTVWRKRLYALLYGASFHRVATAIKEG